MSMPRTLANAIHLVGGDPTEHLWEWIAVYGPHGSAFTWSQSRNEPSGYVGVEHLERIVADREQAEPGLRRRLLSRIVVALSSSEPSLLRRSIQLAAVVGTESEVPCLQTLRSHPDEEVAADAKAATFYLRQRLRRQQ